MNVEYLDHEASAKIVRAFAARVRRRLRSLPRAVMGNEDVEQELWEAWCIARDNYKPDMGIPWAAYLRRGMMNHINSRIDRHIGRFPEAAFALSLDASVGDEEGQTLAEVIPSDIPDASAAVEERSNYEAAKAILSPDAAMFLKILYEQPDELLQEVQKADDKKEMADQLNLPFAVSRRVTRSVIFDVMGISGRRKNEVIKEIQSLEVELA